MTRRQTTNLLLLLTLMLPTQLFADTQQYEYIHDQAGRLVEMRTGSGAILRYTYDENGNISGVTNALSDAIFADGFEETAP